MTHHFELGEIVYLRSGSPPLTVMEYGENNSNIKVTWVNNNGLFETYWFDDKSLTKEKPNF